MPIFPVFHLRDKSISFCTIFLSSRRILYGVECVLLPPHEHKNINIYNKAVSTRGVDLGNFYTPPKKCLHYYMNEHTSNTNKVVIAKQCFFWSNKIKIYSFSRLLRNLSYCRGWPKWPYEPLDSMKYPAKCTTVQKNTMQFSSLLYTFIS